MLELYKRIRQRREELDMSQDELAKKLGYKSRSSINKIEKGENDIPQSKIVAFAEALNTSPEYLMGWDSNEEKNNEETRLIDGYRELNAGGKKIIMDVIGQLNFGNRVISGGFVRPAVVARSVDVERPVARRFSPIRPAEVERPATVPRHADVARFLRFSPVPRVFTNVRPVVDIPATIALPFPLNLYWQGH